MRPSPRRGIRDSLLAIFFLAPFRCRNCRHRFFRFALRQPVPVTHPVTAQRPALTILPAPAVAEIVAAPATASILVAESDPAIRKLLRRVLERQGYAIHELATPDEIASQLRISQVDLLITDLDLPRQAALEAIPLLQAEYPHLKIILLSGYWPRETRPANQVRGRTGSNPRMS